MTAVPSSRHSVSIAGNRSWITRSGTGSSVPTRVISPPATGVIAMSEEQFDRELKYQASMAMVDRMLKEAVISEEDRQRWQDHLMKKYNPPISGIVSKKSS